MDASIKESVKASDKEAQYDEKAKKLLGHKIILAYILVNTVEEFQGMNPKDVVKYIEGEPYISTVPLDPGMTNTKERKEGSIKETETPEQIRGLNTDEYRIFHIFLKQPIPVNVPVLPLNIIPHPRK